MRKIGEVEVARERMKKDGEGGEELGRTGESEDVREVEDQSESDDWKEAGSEKRREERRREVRTSQRSW